MERVAYLPPIWRRVERQSLSGGVSKTASGVAGWRNQRPVKNSRSSWPGPQPQKPKQSLTAGPEMSAIALLQELDVSAEEDAVADFEGLLAFEGSLDAGASFGWVESARRRGLDAGVGDVLEIDDVFGDLDFEGFIDEQAEGACGRMLADDHDAAEVEAGVDVGAGHEKRSFGEMCVRN